MPQVSFWNYVGVHEYTAPYFISIGERGDIQDSDGLIKCEQRCWRTEIQSVVQKLKEEQKTSKVCETE